MNGEALVQAAIRAVVAGILAAIPVAVGFLTGADGISALGQWAIYLPIIIGILNGVAKAIGGATSQPVTTDGVRGADRHGEVRPNPLAI